MLWYVDISSNTLHRALFIGDTVYVAISFKAAYSAMTKRNSSRIFNVILVIKSIRCKIKLGCYGDGKAPCSREVINNQRGGHGPLAHDESRKNYNYKDARSFVSYTTS